MSKAIPVPKIYKVDRTGLNLPKSLKCQQCNIDKPNDAFRLKHRNALTPNYELCEICIACQKLNRGVKQGLFLNHLKQGTRILSDAIIKMLEENDGDLLKQLARVYIEAALSKDRDGLVMMKGLIQPSAPVQHMSSQMMSSMLMDNEEEDESPIPTEETSEATSGDDLLSRLNAIKSK